MQHRPDCNHNHVRVRLRRGDFECNAYTQRIVHSKPGTLRVGIAPTLTMCHSFVVQALDNVVGIQIRRVGVCCVGAIGHTLRHDEITHSLIRQQNHQHNSQAKKPVAVRPHSLQW